jgi:hypothetical protein
MIVTRERVCFDAPNGAIYMDLLALVRYHTFYVSPLYIISRYL